MTKMANKKRLIDANEYPCNKCEVSYCYKNCKKFVEWFEKTVDAVEVVHGEWLWTEENNDDVQQYWVCSKCSDYMYFKTNYCPNCGAGMRDGDGNGTLD